MTTNTHTPEAILKAITDFADRAHGAQMRKYIAAGAREHERYIVHPVRVMNMCREYTSDITILAAALLHDVLEDTPVTANEIAAFLKGLMTEPQVERTLALVHELTDEFVKSNYPDMNRRTRKANETVRLIATSPDAQTIKYADIIDNCTEIVAADKDFAKVFVYECNALLKKMNAGNAALYDRARSIVAECMRQLRGG